MMVEKKMRGPALAVLFFLLFTMPVHGGDSVTVRTLPNGLNLLTLADHSSPLVAVRLIFHVGSKNEAPNATGLTRVCVRVMLEGTARYPRGEYPRIIQGGGGTVSYDTDLDLSWFAAVGPDGIIDSVLILMADRLENTQMTYERLLLAREAIKKERLSRVENNLYGYINEEIMNMAYQVHPYQNPIWGRDIDLDNLTQEDAEAYFRRYFQPANAALIIVGNFDDEKIIEKVTVLFGDIFSQPPEPTRKVAEPIQRGERREILESPRTLPLFVIGYHIPAAADPDLITLKAIGSVLIHGTSGRIYRRLVTEEKSAADIEGMIMQLEDPGLMVFSALLNHGIPLAAGERQVIEEIDRLKTEPITTFELEKAKNRLEADFYRASRSFDQKAQMLGNYFYVFGDLEEMKREIPATRRITGADIMEAANKYFRKSNRTVVILQQPESAAAKEMPGHE